MVSLNNLLQCYTIFPVEKFFIMSNMNLSSWKQVFALLHHLPVPRHAWLHHLCSCLPNSCRLLLDHSLAYSTSDKAHSPQPPLAGHADHPGNHPRKHLQFLDIYFKLVGPKGVFLLEAHQCQVQKNNNFPWSAGNTPNVAQYQIHLQWQHILVHIQLRFNHNPQSFWAKLPLSPSAPSLYHSRYCYASGAQPCTLCSTSWSLWWPSP